MMQRRRQKIVSERQFQGGQQPTNYYALTPDTGLDSYARRQGGVWWIQILC